MTIQEVSRLLDAGFTAEEIRSFDSNSPAVNNPGEGKAAAPKEPAAAPAPEKKAAEDKKDPEPEKKKDPIDSLLQEIRENMANDRKLYEESMAKVLKLAGMPSLDDVKPKGIEDIISNFFKEE